MEATINDPLYPCGGGEPSLFADADDERYKSGKYDDLYAHRRSTKNTNLGTLRCCSH